MKQLVCGRQDRVRLVQKVMLQPCMSQTGTCVCQCTWRMRAGIWGLESKPGKKTTVGCEEIARGDGRERSACPPQPWETAVVKLLPWRGDLCYEGRSFHKSSFSPLPQSQEGLFLGFSMQEPGSPWALN